MKYEPDDKQRHLEFLQLAINRMASNSFILKGWNITLIVGLFALTLKRPIFSISLFGNTPSTCFFGT